MKKPTYKGKELLPLSVIDAARDGDSQAVLYRNFGRTAFVHAGARMAVSGAKKYG